MIRFDIDGKGSTSNKREEAYRMLCNEFAIEEIEQTLLATAASSR